MSENAVTATPSSQPTPVTTNPVPGQVVPPSTQPASSPPPMYMAAAPGQPQQMFVPAAPGPGQVMVPMAQPVQFVAGAPGAPQGGMVFMPQTAANVQPVDESVLPSDHLILVVVITMLCFVFNITSIAFGVPAVLCAYFAFTEKKKGKYASTKSYSYAGVVLSFVNLAYTGIVTLVIIGLTFGLHCGRYYYSCRSRSYY